MKPERGDDAQPAGVAQQLQATQPGRPGYSDSWDVSPAMRRAYRVQRSLDIALEHMTYMHLEPRGSSTAWSAAHTLAMILYEEADDAFRRKFAECVRSYRAALGVGVAPDVEIWQLLMVCQVEMREQGFTTKVSVPSTHHNPLLGGMK